MTRAIVTDALRDLRGSWATLARADIGYKILAFTVLTPAALAVMRWAMFSPETRALADTDIATFFLTTPAGIATLVLGGAVLAGITALEAACLMAIGFAAAQGSRISARAALAFGAARAGRVIRLTANMVVRLIAGLLPFAAAGGAAYWLLLRSHDINFYLARRPPEFWAAAAIGAVIAAALAVLLVRTIAGWALALPLVLFEDILPVRALGESARRSAGDRRAVTAALAVWAIVAVALHAAATALPEVIGRVLAPSLAGSLGGLLVFITALALFWGALGLAAAIVSASLFALVVNRLYLRIGKPDRREITGLSAAADPRAVLPRPIRLAVVAIAALAVVTVALLSAASARRDQPVAVIGHRGSSAGPENTLAAFRLAIEEGAHYVELDVQESADGEVVVVHDSDLMKMGGSPLRIWEATAAELRAVDIGSRKDASFASERVPTLAEALAVCKGRSRLIVELKSYGHNQRLEEKVVALVEAAGMADDTVFMSLDHAMVRKMKALRPAWRTGVLVAKAVGDLTSLGGDFLAVHSALATRSLVRQAHRAGQDVYVWTLNEPAPMLAAMSTGVDGLITDRPALAREAIARRAAMTDAERIAVALLVRLGVRPESIEQRVLRP